MEDQPNALFNADISIKMNILILIPDEASWNMLRQLAASGLGESSGVQTQPQAMELGLGHRPLQPEQETIIEVPRVVDAVGVCKECVEDRA